MKNQKVGKTLFWIGLIFAVAMASIGTQSLMQHLNTLTLEELSTTIWAQGGPLYLLWAMGVTLGSLLAMTGAFLYVRTRKIFPWLTGIVVFIIVFVMVVIYTRVYIPALFGIGGIINLLSFFVIVWIWMKKYAGLDMPAKVAGSYKLIGYIFWINATWFACGETAKLHLFAFQGTSVPSPIELMFFLVLGWLFVMLGDYKEMRLQAN